MAIDDSDETSGPLPMAPSTSASTVSCTGICFVDRAAREQVVDAHGREALEDVLAGALAELALEARQIGQERVGERDREGVFDDGVAVACEAVLVFGQRHPGSVALTSTERGDEQGGWL